MKKSHPEMQIERLLTVWGIIVISWSFFRAYTQIPLWVSEFIAKPFIFIGPVYFYMKRFEPKGSFIRSIGFRGKNILKEFLLAIVLVFILVVVGFFSLSKSSLLSLATIQVQWGKFLLVAALALATALSEEIVGRGFLFQHLFKYSKSFFISFFLSMLLFFILYLPGVLTSGTGGGILLLSFALNIIMTTISVVLYTLRGNLLLPIAVHMAILIWFDLFLL
ncbi:hypothetical protein COU88_02980 [Candidatus Roizmanbacteria bacterium CG10_big_fil_rev_8_21_14_0_10_39_6]|uniref:CAAX prenyl protease 2/Lysostaphin resistance protein A-like domain-containing protein n=1 Tax=Candidatus Roizmanbacteria bacterium CG10_big_fil_rev_8_21_14_0_10_39_6 TaxID=1974853 RepID=A0A2M8KSB2_9BACT|nr:MAG: hypothetical protein COU88_02980 [Candidatus Roizmanbacteria bacterium CG10_big_fil_rev_8_21_14_0_10_39_6]